MAELGQGSESQPHRGNRAGGTATKATPSTQRWVPPTARENVDPIQLVFRKIRGILNKITPDNFERLSFELTNLPAVNNKEALKGAILLVYDKALEESQYTYMYAQLCRRLNDLVPNFEEPGSQSTTFRKLLLHKCQEEFENRRAATASFERRDGLTAEEEEQRSLAKRKMLGNIRFVGELFKIGVLHEAIIHSCIKELLEKKRNQTLLDTIENIECLCHFMTTVGGRLDSTKARGWMDKYFERMKSLTTNSDLPRRIHFMLLDVIELRANNWQPRRSSSDKGPRPIHEIRQEVYQEKSVHPTLPPFKQPNFRGQYTPHHTPSVDEGFLSSPPDKKDQHLFSPQEPVPMIFPLHPYTHPPMQQEVNVAGGVVSEEAIKPVEKKTIRKLPKAKTDNTVSLRPSMASLKLGSSSRSKLDGSGENSSVNSATSLDGFEQVSEKIKVETTRPALPRTRDDSSDEEDHPPQAPKDPNVHPHPPPGPMPPHMYGPGYPPHMMPPREPFYPRGPNPMYPGTHMPPRHMMFAPPHGPILPPPGGHPMPPGPRYYGPPPPRAPPMPPYPGQMYGPPHQGIQPGYGPPPGWATPPLDRPHPPDYAEGDKGSLPPHLDRSEPLKVKYVSTKSGKKGGVGKKPVQDENEKVMEPIIKAFLKSHDADKAVEAIEDVTTVTKETLCTLLLTKTLGKSEDDRTHISGLIKLLHSKEIITSPHFLQAVNKVLGSAGEYETTLPQYKTYLAGFIARAIAHDVVEFRAIATTFELGSHHPTLLVVLQALTALVGEDTVFKKVLESEVKLASLLPVEYRSHEAITQLMESKKLTFLYPLRKIQLELSAKLRQQDITAVTIYKWIKTNVDPSLYPTTEFIMVLTKCILEYVCSESTLAVSQTNNPNKTAVTKEKQLMKKFKILVEKFVSDNVQLQISALYATQTFCHEKQFPKGLLLRLFSYLYDMDVVEEESFFKWKEDLSQEYPGKGRALFQVNHWLVLLAEAEDEESSDES